MAELMRRLLSVLGLLLALGCAGARPAEAYPAGFTAALGAQCGGATLKLDFTANAGAGRYCLGGAVYGNPSAVPGVSFSRASTESCIWADSHLTTAPAGVPCFTDLGLAIWESRTNSFLNSAIGATQTVTTTAASWTLSFYGTGSIVMSGTCSGTLAGTGATARVTLTVTATAGSCVLTVSGSTTDVQIEAGANPTPWIGTTGSAATRAADNLSLTTTFPPQGSIVTAYTVPTTNGLRNELWSFSDSGNSRFGARSNGTGLDPSVPIGNGTTLSNFNVGTPYAVGTAIKMGVAYSTTSAVAGFAVNGTDYSSSASAVQAVAATIALPLYIGSIAGGNQHDGYIRSLTIYSQAFTAAQLQALTQ